MITRSALDILVDQLFDYSGMFPPESKSFADAIVDSANFRDKLKRPYMVGVDIVLTFNEVKNLTEELLINSGYKINSTFKVAVIGSQVVANENDFIDESLYLKGLFSGYQKILPRVCAYEVKVSNHILSNNNLFDKLISSFSCPIAIEPDLSDINWSESLAKAIQIVSGNKEKLTLKIRGTGPTAIDTNKIASVIMHTTKAKINLKATGGLHHPIIEPARYGNNLGFINLAIALYLSHQYQEKFSLEDIKECLLCDCAPQFEVKDQISFKNFSISLDQLKLLKSRFRFGIGSCSLTEPDSDLCRLFDNE